ncbi:MAG TPA: FMN-binding negative transcriptional regulator [Afifellaceae bacterium]|nr:FMN-binding negative transcriptional regulator [Afifellaceae bacterium]
MHPNPVFRKTPQDDNIAFARRRSFGVLAVNADTGPLVSHIPFQLSSDGAYLEAHILRSNPIARLLGEPAPAVLAVSGGDTYLSPDWYGVENQVPTWNYVAVHLRGTLKLLPGGELRGILDRLAENMETRLLPKKPWTIDKMDTEIFARMARQIVPVAMKISDIQGTWKLSQNKSSEARDGAMDGVAQARIGAEVDEIVALMGAVESE